VLSEGGPMNRTRKIVQTSIIGIIANVFLAAFKAFIGIISNSVAITMDAVNNLSDAMSSFITIVGARLSAKEPDKEHPYGYGRIEYLTTMVIGVIILYAGITSLIESVQKIINPATPDYSAAALIIVTAAIIVKILLGLYTKKSGEKLSSDSLVASEKDALNDSIISASTLLAAIIFITTGLSIEAFVGIIIAVMIIKTGFETLKETIGEILGARISTEISKSVKNSINSFPEVNGVYDLLIHDYGNQKLVGSAHIEIPDDITVPQIDKLERQIATKVLKDTGIFISGISIYSMNTSNQKATELRAKVNEIIKDYPNALQMHGLYIDEEEKKITFDLVISFKEKDKKGVIDKVKERVEKIYEGYDVQIALDYDYSD